MTQGEWPPLEQDWPRESTPDRSDVRLLTIEEIQAQAVQFTEQTPDRINLTRGEELRRSILDESAEHIETAVESLRRALDVFAVVDSGDRSDVLRAVEAIAETIDYRRSV